MRTAFLMVLSALALVALVAGTAYGADALYVLQSETVVRKTAEGGVVVPDLTRMGVDQAHSTINALGLRLRTRDPFHEEIGVSVGDGYIIRRGSMSPPPGTVVAPGTLVRAGAYENFGFVAGY